MMQVQCVISCRLDAEPSKCNRALYLQTVLTHGVHSYLLLWLVCFRLGPCDLQDPLWVKMSAAVSGGVNKKRKKTDTKPHAQAQM